MDANGEKLWYNIAYTKGGICPNPPTTVDKGSPSADQMTKI
jgi:hypothetical protein